MKPDAITQAKTELTYAQSAVEALQLRSPAKGTIEKGWRDFLFAFYTTLQKLKAGAKDNAGESIWFEQAMQFILNGDELLKYVYNARTVAQHGIGQSAKKQDLHLSAKEGANTRREKKPDGTFRIVFTTSTPTFTNSIAGRVPQPH